MEDLRHATVLGAGTMGPSIAAAFAAAGVGVTLWARRAEAARAGAASAEAAAAYLRDAGLAPGSAGVVEPEGDLRAAVADTGIVVEAISENAAVKRGLYADVEEVAAVDLPIASTTSGLGMEELAHGARHPHRFLVLHFWNPAHLIPLVEVLGGDETEPELLEAAESLLRRLGKHPVRLHRFAPGFIGTRLQQAVVREAIALLEAGVADAGDIDAATRLSFGARFPVMGPLETCDLGGLDVIAAIHQYLLSDLDTSSAPQRALVERVERGDLGAKAGRGFYDWSDRDAETLRRDRDEELVERLRRLQAAGQLPLPGAGDPA